MHTILIVEDEFEIRNAMKNFLVREGYKVLLAEDGEQAIEIFNRDEVHLILLDLMLPKVPGEKVLEHVRKSSDVPIIIISALDDELIQQDAFMQKVDDYVIKPFSIQILVYKIKAIMRRMYAKKQEYIEFENVRLTVNNYEVIYEEAEVKLTAKEFELLQVLMLNRGQVYSRSQLLTLVWGYDYYGDDRIIDVHIKNIRKKLYPDIIVTVTGVGYKTEREA